MTIKITAAIGLKFKRVAVDRICGSVYSITAEWEPFRDVLLQKKEPLGSFYIESVNLRLLLSGTFHRFNKLTQFSEHDIWLI